MKTLDEIREILLLQKNSLCKNYQITEIGIFSSYARGEETAPTFIMLVELRYYLSQVFGLKVDIVTKNGLKSGIHDLVLAEAIYI